MRWPQFQLWRLLVAIGLFGAALACLLARPPNFAFEGYAVWKLSGVILLAASLGTPFKKGMLFALYTPVTLFFLAVFLSGIVRLFF